MLESIKNTIDTLPDISFGEYYQQYVIQTQDVILDNMLNIADKQYTDIEDVTELIKGLNKLTKELS